MLQMFGALSHHMFKVGWPGGQEADKPRNRGGRRLGVGACRGECARACVGADAGAHGAIWKTCVSPIFIVSWSSRLDWAANS